MTLDNLPFQPFQQFLVVVGVAVAGLSRQFPESLPCLPSLLPLVLWR